METTKLNKLCLHITDGTHSTVNDCPNGNHYLLSCKNVKNGHIIFSSTDRLIDSLTFNSLRKRTKLSKNDVILTTVGTIGESSVIKIDNPKYEFQRSVGIIKPNLNLVVPEYLHYYFSSLVGKKEINSRIKGAAQPCLFLNDLKDLNILIFPLSHQQHIVNNRRTTNVY